MIKLSDLFNQINDVARNSATGTLTNSKRARAVNWTIRDLQNFCDWKPLRRTFKFDFSGVNEYDFKNLGITAKDKDGTTVKDFKNPYHLRAGGNNLEFKDAKDVRTHIENNRFLSEYGIDGNNLIILYPKQTTKLIANCNSLTADGIWSASNDAINLTIDDVVYKTSDGSFNFDVSGGTELTIDNENLSEVDLSTFKDNSYWVMWSYLPTITNFSNITIKWGSSTSDYYTVEQTAPVEDLSIGENEFTFKWEGATQTGTPDNDKMNYLSISINYSSAITDTAFRIDDIRIAKKVEMDFTVYPRSFIYNSDGNRKLLFNETKIDLDEYLVDDRFANTIIEGTVYRIFRIQGGQRESDYTDAKRNYFLLKQQLKNEIGVTNKKPIRKLKFRR